MSRGLSTQAFRPRAPGDARGGEDEPGIEISPDRGMALDSSGLCDICPAWTFRAAPSFCTRRDDPPRAVVVEPTTGATVLDASQLNHSLRGGLELDAVRRLGAFDVEFRYFSVDESTAKLLDYRTRADIDVRRGAVPRPAQRLHELRRGGHVL